ncbi:VOC family protein [Nonomuraea africana]|uniref:Catechol 2,3-dioxygenase-like lactoylglutathione lyase family enzyme n=1 Tax=Nonomuraea africana TaxID=46171 RepID=A0ABR9KBJ1_9ACTN|nr:VOC family protein [Nonomuraea africana]MBE1559381.1 catechol 2,3-dioxygenase-like lactoylglutathione lyase family enzyme [Nonomuraea africana]
MDRSAMEWKLEVVPVPVADVERAKRFYTEQAGFHADHDTQVNATVRIVQLTPPGSACSIVIGAPVSTPPGVVQGLQLVVRDIAAARAQLVERGVEVSGIQHYEKDGTLADGPGGRWNSFAFFSDPDGNGWVLQESPT